MEEHVTRFSKHVTYAKCICRASGLLLPLTYVSKPDGENLSRVMTVWVAAKRAEACIDVFPLWVHLEFPWLTFKSKDRTVTFKRTHTHSKLLAAFLFLSNCSDGMIFFLKYGSKEKNMKSTKIKLSPSQKSTYITDISQICIWGLFVQFLSFIFFFF